MFAQLDKTAKILAVLLFVSLAGNAFTGSMLLGQAARGGWHGEGRSEWKEREAYLLKKLPEADRETMKRSFSDREKFHALRDKLDQAKSAVWDASKAEPFDQAALDRAMEKEQTLKAEFLQMIRAKRAAMMEQLSPEGRRVMEDADKRFGKRFEKWKGGQHQKRTHEAP